MLRRLGSEAVFRFGMKDGRHCYGVYYFFALAE